MKNRARVRSTRVYDALIALGRHSRELSYLIGGSRGV